MTAESLALVRKMNELPRGWRFVPGMLSLPDATGRTWRRIASSPEACNMALPVFVQEAGPRGFGWGAEPRTLLPDFDDAATLGCVEHILLREAWPGRLIDRTEWVDSDGVSWVGIEVDEDEDNPPEFVGRSLGEALLAALRGAP